MSAMSAMKLPLLSAMILVSAVSPLMANDWRIVREAERQDNGLTYRQVALRSDSDGAANLQLIWFSPREFEFKVVSNQEQRFTEIKDAVLAINGIAGVNGGYFHDDLTPVGLVIAGGRMVHKGERAKLISGIFCVRDGTPSIVRSSSFQGVKGVEEALQCGPFLVERTRPVPGLNAVRQAARTFVFRTSLGRWGIGICHGPTLAAQASMLALANLLPGQRIETALNLDGGPSTGFYLRMSDEEVVASPWSIVSNFLVVASRK
jgi:uncharacterized protein YigE (DUF2233 family)